MYQSYQAIGNLAADPVVRETSSGKTVANLRLAVNEKKSAETLFVDVVCWEQAAEFARDYLNKGRQVFVEGRLTQQEWEQEGETRRKLVVTAWRVLGLERNGRNKEEKKSEGVPF